MFAVSEHAELLALLRTLIAGKFGAAPFDQELMASPIVARFCREVADLVDCLDQEKFGESIGRNSQEWRLLDDRRDEWRAALAYASKRLKPHWAEWNEAKRIQVIGDLVSPFLLDQWHYDQFVAAMLKEDESKAPGSN